MQLDWCSLSKRFNGGYCWLLLRYSDRYPGLAAGQMFRDQDATRRITTCNQLVGFHNLLALPFELCIDTTLSLSPINRRLAFLLIITHSWQFPVGFGKQWLLLLSGFKSNSRWFPDEQHCPSKFENMFKSWLCFLSREVNYWRHWQKYLLRQKWLHRWKDSIIYSKMLCKSN